MKLILLVALVLSCFLFSVYGSAVEINLGKTEYAAGETLQAYLIIDEIEEELSINNIKLIDGSMNRVSVTPFLNKLKDDYYVYFNLPIDLDLDNYSIVVEDVIYTNENGLLVQGDFSADFTIVEKETVISVDPGIIMADDLDSQNTFNIYLYNHGELTLVDFSVDSEYISLSEDELPLSTSGYLDVYVSELIGDVDTKYLSINYNGGSYSIPIWLGGEGVAVKNETPINNTPEENISIEGVSIEFLTEQDFINITINKNKSKYISIEFQNKGNLTVEDIEFSLEGNISLISSLGYSNLDILSPGEIAKQNVRLNSDKNALGYYTGKLIMNYGDVKEFVFDIYFVEESVPDVVLPDDSIFIGDEENYEPETEEDGETNYWILFGFIFAVILFVIYILYIKHRKKQNKGFWLPTSRFAS
ncbi:MAG: hypothetical protein ABIH25_02060 [Candidatus Woesearchaeota archaeon]